MTMKRLSTENGTTRTRQCKGSQKKGEKTRTRQIKGSHKNEKGLGQDNEKDHIRKWKDKEKGRTSWKLYYDMTGQGQISKGEHFKP